jgi:hypothetical protein
LEAPNIGSPVSQPEHALHVPAVGETSGDCQSRLPESKLL